MGDIRSFKDLDAWKLGMDAIELTYRLTADFPAGERFGLTSQMRRASISIPSNVAEGQAVRAPRWTLRHVVIAIGSSAELQWYFSCSREPSNLEPRISYLEPRTSNLAQSSCDNRA